MPCAECGPDGPCVVCATYLDARPSVSDRTPVDLCRLPALPPPAGPRWSQWAAPLALWWVAGWAVGFGCGIWWTLYNR